MLKPLIIATSLVLVHDEHRLPDWIGESKLRDPETHELCCGINDCKAVPFGGVIEIGDSY
jgi:hypothetical protein